MLSDIHIRKQIRLIRSFYKYFRKERILPSKLKHWHSMFDAPLRILHTLNIILPGISFLNDRIVQTKENSKNKSE